LLNFRACRHAMFHKWSEIVAALRNIYISTRHRIASRVAYIQMPTWSEKSLCGRLNAIFYTHIPNGKAPRLTVSRMLGEQVVIRR
jgi:hypothetical protein